PVAPEYDERNNQFVLVDPEGFGQTQVIFSERGESNGKGFRYDITLAPRATWSMRIDVGLGTNGEAERAPHVVEHHFGEERARVGESVAAWELRVPQIRGEQVPVGAGSRGRDRRGDRTGGPAAAHRRQVGGLSQGVRQLRRPEKFCDPGRAEGCTAAGAAAGHARAHPS